MALPKRLTYFELRRWNVEEKQSARLASAVDERCASCAIEITNNILRSHYANSTIRSIITRAICSITLDDRSRSFFTIGDDEQRLTE
jgi:hypothetical protein